MSNETNPSHDPYTPRQLSDEEREIIRRAQAYGPSLRQLFADAGDLVIKRSAESGSDHGAHQRSIALAKTNIEQGLLWLEHAMRAEPVV